MRKLIVVVTVVMFGVGLLGVSVVSQVRPTVALAETNEVRVLTAEERQEATESSEWEDGITEGTNPPARLPAGTWPAGGTESTEKEVDYYLPYPGILPDHPLYWLKMVRDRVMLWLTREPAAKVDRLLLYADKRIGAARVLAEGNQPELAVATATKAEKYLEQVREAVVAAGVKIEGEAELMEKLKLAYLKHQEVLEAVYKQVPAEAKPVLDQMKQMTEAGYRKLVEMTNASGKIQEEEMMEGGEEATSSSEKEREGLL